VSYPASGPTSFGRQIIGAFAQVLAALPQSVVQTVLNKHFDDVPWQVDHMKAYFDFLMSAHLASVESLFVDLLTHAAIFRAYAGQKYVFDASFEEFRGWLAHDGWELKRDRLMTSLPSIEESTGVRDRLLELLEQSPLDLDGHIRRELDDSVTAFRSNPPDISASTTRVRIALETVARRGAPLLASKLQEPAPVDTWGHAIGYLRAKDVLNANDEKAITASYTLISPGAHIPKNMSDVEWARVSRTVALSFMYYLTQLIHDAL
jgi:hypothetical protein